MNAIYSGLSGMQAAATLQGVTANNIANINTPSFKSKLASLSELSGGGVRIAGITADSRDGYPIPTGNPNDVAIFGHPANIENPAEYYGNIASRFRMDSFGNLLDPSGNLLFTGAGGNVRLDTDGNLFQNDQLIGTITPAGGAGGEMPVGETMLSGFVMGSNVNITNELVNNMTNLRYFQLNAKTIRTADEMFGTLLDMKG